MRSLYGPKPQLLRLLYNNHLLFSSYFQELPVAVQPIDNNDIRCDADDIRDRQGSMRLHAVERRTEGDVIVQNLCFFVFLLCQQSLRSKKNGTKFLYSKLAEAFVLKKV